MTTRRLFLVGLLAGSIFAASCSSGNQDTLTQGTATQDSATSETNIGSLPVQEDRIVTTPSVAAIGQDVLDYRASTPDAAPSPGFDPIQSIPVDLDHDGEYLLQAGPVPADTDLLAVAVAAPNDVDGTVIIDPASRRLVKLNGESYFEIVMTVSDLRQAYPGFSAWIY